MNRPRPWLTGLAAATLALASVSLAQMEHGHAHMDGTDGDHHGSAATSDADFDEAFLVGMIAHHEGAVDMADWLLDRSGDRRVRAWADDVLRAQGPEIAQMREWLEEWGLDAAGVDPTMREEMAAMLERMEASTDDPDTTFLRYMTVHHAGAIDMAQAALVETERQEIRELARDVILTQAREIFDYQTYLAR